MASVHGYMYENEDSDLIGNTNDIPDKKTQEESGKSHEHVEENTLSSDFSELATVPAAEKKKGKQQDRGAARRRKQASKLSAEEKVTIETKEVATEQALVKEQVSGVGNAISISKTQEPKGDVSTSQIKPEVEEIRAGDGIRTLDTVSYSPLESRVTLEVASLRASSSASQPTMHDHEIVQVGRLLLQLWSTAHEGCLQQLDWQLRAAHGFNQDAYDFPHAYPTEGEAREAAPRSAHVERRDS